MPTKIRAFFCIAAVGLFSSCGTTPHSHSPTRVACVGDSITYGYGIKDREHDSYPAQLGALLGNEWDVRNFGVNGATALKRGTKPYTGLQAYQDALAFEPDIVVIKLGTNDTNAKSWPIYKEEFISDYLEIIRSFQKLKTRPRIYLCRPVPLFRDRGKEYDTDKILTLEVIPEINKAAKQTRLPLIDFHAAFEGKGEMLPDGVHPDARGTKIMAQMVHSKIAKSRKTK